MLLFRKLVDETQMPTTPEATSYHSLRKSSILQPHLYQISSDEPEPSWLELNNFQLRSARLGS